MLTLQRPKIPLPQIWSQDWCQRWGFISLRLVATYALGREAGSAQIRCEDTVEGNGLGSKVLTEVFYLQHAMVRER